MVAHSEPAHGEAFLDHLAHIEPAHWEAFLDHFAKTHDGYEARIEVMGRVFGDQEMAAWLPLAGMSYDPHHHHIFVTVGGLSRQYPVHLTHTIRQPRTLAVHQTPAGEIDAIRIVSEDGTTTLVNLRRPPQRML
jgi:hypothetical protein